MEGVFKNYLVAPKRGVYKDTKIEPGCLFCKLTKNLPKRTPSIISVGSINFYVIKTYKSHVLIVNPFPYSPRGHLEIVSKRHVEKFKDLTQNEFSELKNIIGSSMEALTKAYKSKDFNIGLNLGKAAGASIPHFHIHVVPRFEAESGFLETVASTRVIAEESEVTMKKVHDNL